MILMTCLSPTLTHCTKTKNHPTRVLHDCKSLSHNKTHGLDRVLWAVASLATSFFGSSSYKKENIPSSIFNLHFISCRFNRTDGHVGWYSGVKSLGNSFLKVYENRVTSSKRWCTRRSNPKTGQQFRCCGHRRNGMICGTMEWPHICVKRCQCQA